MNFLYIARTQSTSDGSRNKKDIYENLDQRFRYFVKFYCVIYN